MKLAASSFLVSAAAALALLAGLGSAQSCPTLQVRARAPRRVRNNKVYSVILEVQNTGTTAATDLALTVRLD
jgi:hypothetical protein